MDQKKLSELRDYYDNTDTSAEIADAELDNEVAQSPMVGITVRFPVEVLQQVRLLASRNNVKTTALIRRWVEDAIERDTEMPAAGGFTGLQFHHSTLTALRNNVDVRSFRMSWDTATRNAGLTAARAGNAWTVTQGI
ncbi:MAG: hypothetical protein WBH51_10945 [Mycolicibacter algericus]|uniref:hypothetical protein n=1 Tax=Mycolicibacter algericus TaxID=1288388 RepID=UPI003C75651F